MKKAVSIFILCCIFIGSFYAQKAHSGLWIQHASIQSTVPGSGDPNCNKSPIFTEISSEKEDSESKMTIEAFCTSAGHFHLRSEFKQSSNILNEYSDDHLIRNSIPLFIKNRNILI